MFTVDGRVKECELIRTVELWSLSGRGDWVATLFFLEKTLLDVPTSVNSSTLAVPAQ